MRFFRYPRRHGGSLPAKPDRLETAQGVSRQEIATLVRLAAESGSLEPFQSKLIEKIIGLDELLVREVLTPRVLVFRREQSQSLQDVEHEIVEWSHTRVPLYSERDPDHLSSYIMQRDVYRELLRGNKQLRLQDLSRPLETVPELMRVDRCLQRMCAQREQICTVVDEHGALAGIVTLRDLVEELIGRTLADEYDPLIGS